LYRKIKTDTDDVWQCITLFWKVYYVVFVSFLRTWTERWGKPVFNAGQRKKNMKYSLSRYGMCNRNSRLVWLVRVFITVIWWNIIVIVQSIKSLNEGKIVLWCLVGRPNHQDTHRMRCLTNDGKYDGSLSSSVSGLN